MTIENKAYILSDCPSQPKQYSHVLLKATEET